MKIKRIIENIKQVGLQYGPSFQVINEILSSDQEALAEISLPR
jgi:hypothetical protein